MDDKKQSTKMEVTCRYESSKVYLLQREEEKVAKYRKLIEHELDQFECKTGEVTSIVIGNMDTIPDKINQELKRLGLTEQREAIANANNKGQSTY